MRLSLVDDLRCQRCGGSLEVLEEGGHGGDEVTHGSLRCAGCGAGAPIRDGIPRFVPTDNYASSFGLQWNRHARTQLDKFNGTSISRDRLCAETAWNLSTLGEERILEVGCGAGRFTQVLLETGARVYSVDYSAAVDACLSNNGPHERLSIIQADLYRLPLKQGYFDKVLCLGVLQHTPDPRGALSSLILYLKAGGEIVVDVYPARLFSLLHPRYLLRSFTRRMDPESLHAIVVQWAPRLLAASDGVLRLPLVGSFAARAIPVANYRGKLALSEEQLVSWAVLNTFDWLSPRYDKPQRASTMARWLADAGLGQVRVSRITGGETGRGGVIVAKGTKL